MVTSTAERTEFLTDIVVTAIENYGYGWFSVEDYDCDNGTARIFDQHDDDAPYSVSIDVIAKGLGEVRDARMHDAGDESYLVSRQGKRMFMPQGMRKSIMEADRENDAGNLDVVDALAILECGLFGQVVYA